MATKFKQEGDSYFRSHEFENAIDRYTQGLNAITSSDSILQKRALYSNRSGKGLHTLNDFIYKIIYIYKLFLSIHMICSNSCICSKLSISKSF